MKCGLRSKAAVVKSLRSRDIEVIISKNSMAPQQESSPRRMLKKAVLVVRETQKVKGDMFRRKSIHISTFHISRFTFHGS